MIFKSVVAVVHMSAHGEERREQAGSRAYWHFQVKKDPLSLSLKPAVLMIYKLLLLRHILGE